MSKFNWDKIRRQELVYRRGSVRASDEFAPEAAEHKIRQVKSASAEGPRKSRIASPEELRAELKQALPTVETTNALTLDQQQNHLANLTPYLIPLGKYGAPVFSVIEKIVGTPAPVSSEEFRNYFQNSKERYFVLECLREVEIAIVTQSQNGTGVRTFYVPAPVSPLRLLAEEYLGCKIVAHSTDISLIRGAYLRLNTSHGPVKARWERRIGRCPKYKLLENKSTVRSAPCHNTGSSKGKRNSKARTETPLSADPVDLKGNGHLPKPREKKKHLAAMAAIRKNSDTSVSRKDVVDELLRISDLARHQFARKFPRLPELLEATVRYIRPKFIDVERLSQGISVRGKLAYPDVASLAEAIRSLPPEYVCDVDALPLRD